MSCAFGRPWTDHAPFALPLLACPDCRDETARLCASFDAAVAAGQFDADGYSPSEQRLKQRCRYPRRKTLDTPRQPE